MTILVIAVSALHVAFDFQNLLSWWRGKVIEAGADSSTDFTIVVPLFGHPRYFDGRAARTSRPAEPRTR
jgi:hypothetical protein